MFMYQLPIESEVMTDIGLHPLFMGNMNGETSI